jgi:phospholipid/cholesterol/gamma-HCH transport system substrate-binding protein
MKKAEFGESFGAPQGKGAGTKLRALVFALVPLLALTVLGVSVAWKQGAFKVHDRLFTFADTATGVAVGMQVKIQGFSVGTVKELELVPGTEETPSRVRIAFEINREYLKLVDKDSTILLTREGLIGQPILEIHRGKGGERRAADADVLIFERARSVADVAEEVGGKLGPILGEAKEMVNRLKDPEGDLMGALRDARSTVKTANSTAGDINALVGDARQAIGGVSQSTQKTLESADQLLRATEKELPKLDRIIGEAATTAALLRDTAQQAQAPLLEAVRGSAHGVAEANSLIGGVKRAWPLRQMLPAAPPPVLIIDTQDSTASSVVLPKKTEASQ